MALYLHFSICRHIVQRDFSLKSKVIKFSLVNICACDVNTVYTKKKSICPRAGGQTWPPHKGKGKDVPVSRRWKARGDPVGQGSGYSWLSPLWRWYGRPRYLPAVFTPRRFLVLIFRGWVDPRAHGSVGGYRKTPHRHHWGSIPRPSD